MANKSQRSSLASKGPATLDFVRMPPGHHGDGVDKFQVVLIRGGEKRKKI